MDGIDVKGFGSLRVIDGAVDDFDDFDDFDDVNHQTHGGPWRSSFRCLFCFPPVPEKIFSRLFKIQPIFLLSKTG